MTMVHMIVVSVLALMGMTCVSRCMLMLVVVSMFVFMPVFVRVFGIAMQVFVRVNVGVLVFMFVSVFVSFFHVDLLNLNGSIQIIPYSILRLGRWSVTSSRSMYISGEPLSTEPSGLSDN